MARILKRDFYSAQFLKKVIKFTNAFIICVLSTLVVLIICYNGMILASRTNIKDNNSMVEYGKLGDYYLVQVKTDNWRSFYPQFTLLFVKDQQITYDYLVEQDSKGGADKVYFFRKELEEENAYLVGKIKAKTQENVVISGDSIVEYSNIIGEVSEAVPVVAIFNNEWFLFFVLLLIAAFVGIVIYFTSIDLGYDMMFENQVERELKKDVTFGLKMYNQVKSKKKPTNEEVVEGLVSKIIVGSQEEDKEIPIENVINALKVVDEQNLKTNRKVFVYFASINLLNAYIKREDALECMKGYYYFKKFAGKAMDYLTSVNAQIVSAYSQDQLLMVNCLGMEFSFHNVKTEHNYPSKNWSGLKLQPYANTIFELFYDREFGAHQFKVKDKEIDRIITAIAEELEGPKEENKEENTDK